MAEARVDNVSAVEPPAVTTRPASTAPAATIAPQLVRLTICILSGVTVFLADIMTKASAHPLVLHHYRQFTPIEFGAIALFLLFLALYRSNLLALAAGCFLGTLLGNGGELLLHGYATDWIQLDLGIDDRLWLTNIADIAAALGLLLVIGDFTIALYTRRTSQQRAAYRAINLVSIGAATLAFIAGKLTNSLDAGLIVFVVVLVEAWVVRKLLAVSH